MKTNTIIFLLSTCLCSLFCSCNDIDSSQGKEFTLWMDDPAAKWEEALPIGNGRLGAMIYGNPFHECIQVNEESLWSGAPINSNNPEAGKNLDKVRELALSGRISEAHKLSAETMVGIPTQVSSYQTC